MPHINPECIARNPKDNSIKKASGFEWKIIFVKEIKK